MKNKIILMITLAVFGIAFSGCKASSGSEKAAETKSEKTNTTAEKKDSEKKNSDPAKKEEKSKTALKDSKKPEGESKTAKKNNPIPDDWIYVYEENKGFGFNLPDGSTGEQSSYKGYYVLEGATPPPSELGYIVIAFKDKNMTKENLLDIAIQYLENEGETIKASDLTAESDDYSIATAETVKDGVKGKARILVGLDVTDNYILIIGGDEDKFNANEKMVDEVWGSFEMWSGGASGVH